MVMLIMISIILKAETAYLAIFENRQISIMKKKDDFLRKDKEKSELSEIGKVRTS